MEVIPAVNCEDFECVKAKIGACTSFLAPRGWVHIDVTDARFTYNRTWGNPDEFRSARTAWPALEFEIHLMVDEPEKVAEDWLRAGAKRIIVHLEALLLKEPGIPRVGPAMDEIVAIAKKYNAEVTLAIGPHTDTEVLNPYIQKFQSFQILAVEPGLAGQQFIPSSFDKIKALRAAAPNAIIEIDGGINAETASLAVAAGANRLVAASYIFGSPDPALAYSKLLTIN